MSSIGKRFLESEHGSFVPALAVALVPLLAAVGMVTDYSAGVTERSDMQAALDAASLSIMTLPKDLTKDERQKKLQSAYEVNGGRGTTKLGAYNVAVDGTVTMSTSANYAMPTAFMALAGIDSVAIGVKAAARKNPALMEATFKVTKVSGYWNKSMYLYGVKFGETAVNKLMQIDYAYNNFGDPKGYGTSNVYTVSGTTKTLVQQQVCTTAIVSSFSGAPASAYQQTSGGKKFLTTCTMSPANGPGAVIDVSQMNALYLVMDLGVTQNRGIAVSSNVPKKLQSDDPATSNRLYIGKGYATAAEKAAKPADYLPVESPTGKTVDIFNAVPCGQTSDQAWEDGGNAVPADVSNADFFYSVSGKCNFSQRASEVSLTQ